jgi:hypothetical protein
LELVVLAEVASVGAGAVAVEASVGAAGPVVEGFMGFWCKAKEMLVARCVIVMLDCLVGSNNIFEVDGQLTTKRSRSISNASSYRYERCLPRGTSQISHHGKRGSFCLFVYLVSVTHSPFLLGTNLT